MTTITLVKFGLKGPIKYFTKISSAIVILFSYNTGTITQIEARNFAIVP